MTVNQIMGSAPIALFLALNLALKLVAFAAVDSGIITIQLEQEYHPLSKTSSFSSHYIGPAALQHQPFHEHDILESKPTNYLYQKPPDPQGREDSKVLTLPPTIFLRDYDSSLLAANVAIGTPAQDILVEFSLHSSDFWLLGANAEYEESCNNKKTLYNESSSSTFRNNSWPFSSAHGGVRGYFATDAATISGIRLDSLTFGVAQVVRHSRLKSELNSGVFGLGRRKWAKNDKDGNITAPVRQLLDQLGADANSLPLATLFLQRREARGLNGFAVLTLGGEDYSHCDANYVYVDAAEPSECGKEEWSFHLDSACMGNGSECFFQPGTLVRIDEAYAQFFATPAMFNFFRRVTGAEYRRSSGGYSTSCELSQMPTLTLTVGEAGRKTMLQLAPEDYIAYSAEEGVCYLQVVPYYSNARPRLDLGYRYLNRHCISLDYGLARVGISSVRPALGVELREENFAMIGKLRIGSQAQELRFWFPFDRNSMWVMDEEADYVEWSRDRKQLYRHSLSSTYWNTTMHFMDGTMNYGYTAKIYGHFASDVINLSNDVRVNMTFGVANVVGERLLWVPCDAELGLSPASKLSSTSLVAPPLYQLLSQLPHPVMSLYLNYSVACKGCPKSFGVLTFGAEDSMHCSASSYVYTPRVTSQREPNDYLFTAESISIAVRGHARQDYSTIEAKVNITVRYRSKGLWLPRRVADFIARSVNATSRFIAYELPSCDTHLFPDLMMNVAGVKNSRRESIPLYLEDYVQRDNRRDHCTLALYGVDYEPSVGYTFMRSHCMAFNTAENMLGFGVTKEKLGVA